MASYQFSIILYHYLEYLISGSLVNNALLLVIKITIYNNLIKPLGILNQVIEKKKDAKTIVFEIEMDIFIFNRQLLVTKFQILLKNN